MFACAAPSGLVFERTTERANIKMPRYKIRDTNGATSVVNLAEDATYAALVEKCGGAHLVLKAGRPPKTIACEKPTATPARARAKRDGDAAAARPGARESVWRARRFRRVAAAAARGTGSADRAVAVICQKDAAPPRSRCRRVHDVDPARAFFGRDEVSARRGAPRLESVARWIRRRHVWLGGRGAAAAARRPPCARESLSRETVRRARGRTARGARVSLAGSARRRDAAGAVAVPPRPRDDKGRARDGFEGSSRTALRGEGVAGSARRRDVWLGRSRCRRGNKKAARRRPRSSRRAP